MDVIDQLCTLFAGGSAHRARTSCPHLTPIGVPRSLSISRMLKFPGLVLTVSDGVLGLAPLCIAEFMSPDLL